MGDFFLVVKYLSLKKSILFTVAIYLSAILIGSLIICILQPDIGNIKFTNSQNTWYSYFYHNYSINLLLIIGGILFWIPSLVILFINGLISGFFISQSVFNYQLDKLLLGIVSHGIFEIPAMILSGALGLQIAAFLYQVLIKKSPHSIKKIHLIKSFVGITILTLIAAIIETSFNLLNLR